MPEPIFQRVRRILNARLEDAVDRMERSGSDGVMREAIREVDRVIDEVNRDYETAMGRRLQAARQQKAFKDKAVELTGKAQFALAEGREDLAEAALNRQVDLEAQAEKLDAVQADAGEAETRLSENLAALKARKREMEDALQAFLASRRDAALGGDGPAKTPSDLEKRVERAEQAFDRAMTGAGGVGFSRANAETTHRVAEIDVMQKHAVVATRLAALKQAAGSL